MTKEPCHGYCEDCRAPHSLGEGRAREHALTVMSEFSRHGRLDYDSPIRAADPCLGAEQLWQDQQGQMYGVLECEDASGRTTVLRAFSSLPGGVRRVHGWAPPIVDQEIHEERILSEERRIKEVTCRMQELPSGSAEFDRLSEHRRELSRTLMATIHDLYEFRNFRNQTRSLREIFSPSRSIPGGVGDCCAPKLLHHAATLGLRPRGLIEFYWGGSTPSGSRRSGEFYSCCASRCQPILGFLLCGLDS